MSGTLQRVRSMEWLGVTARKDEPMTPTETIYRVSLPNGENIHTGYKPLAEVWAKNKGAVLSEIALTTPPEIHAITPRHELLPRLRRLARDFQSHPLSRGISECEEAGLAMAEAVQQIEMLCRTRDTVVNHSGRMRKEIAQLTEHRDFLLREMTKIDKDPSNACHYASEAISEICAAGAVPPVTPNV